jgi:hypothetical protein
MKHVSLKKVWLPKNCIPLIVVSEEDWLCLRGIDLVEVKENQYGKTETKKIVTLPLKNRALLRVVSSVPILKRRLHFFPSQPIVVGNHIYFSLFGSLIEFNLIKRTASIETRLENGARRTISMTSLSSVPSFSDSLVFGEYLDNKNHDGVSIFQKKNEDEWKKVYTFKRGEIRHIHAIVPDKETGCVFVFTGDDENEVKIISFKNDFKTCEIVAFGKQDLRTCSPHLTARKAIIYATDTPFFPNHIFEFDNKRFDKPVELTTINGTCIYSQAISDNVLVFSSCVEDNLKRIEQKNSKIKIDGRNGGILSNDSIVYVWDHGDVYSILQERKDFLSSKFGFGTFFFSAANMRSVIATPLGLVNKRSAFLIKETIEQ